MVATDLSEGRQKSATSTERKKIEAKVKVRLSLGRLVYKLISAIQEALAMSRSNVLGVARRQTREMLVLLLRVELTHPDQERTCCASIAKASL